MDTLTVIALVVLAVGVVLFGLDTFTHGPHR